MSSNIKINSNVKKLRYTVNLKLATCFFMTDEEKIEYKVIDSKDGYPYNIKYQTIKIEDRQIPLLPKDTVHRIDTTIRSYDQIPCKINGNLTSILLNPALDLEEDGSILLHGELLERVQNENARLSYYTNGALRRTQYLAYGFEFQDEYSNDVHQYSGFLTDFDRNRCCFERTGSIFHGTVREISTDRSEILNLATEAKKLLQKTK